MDSKGWTQQAIAESTGLTYQTVNAFFNARGKVVNDSLVKIAEALEIPLEDLFIEERLGQLSPDLEDRIFAAFERTIARLTAPKAQPAAPMLQAAEMPIDERGALNSEVLAILAKLPVKGVRQSLMLVQAVLENYEISRAEKAQNKGDVG
jgi:transcriptional regulator with XRE-family HTH domain